MEDLGSVKGEFCSYLDHWKCLAKIEFEASLGEMDGSAGDGQGSFVRGAIVRSIENKDTLSCSWAEEDNVGTRFSVGRATIVRFGGWERCSGQSLHAGCDPGVEDDSYRECRQR